MTSGLVPTVEPVTDLHQIQPSRSFVTPTPLNEREYSEKLEERTGNPIGPQIVP